MNINSLDGLRHPDERTLRFTPLGFSPMGTLKPEKAAEYQQRVIANSDLCTDVPDDTRNGFERLRTLHSYGVLCYETFTVASDLAWLVMEQAFRERFITYHEGSFAFVNSRSGQEQCIETRDFDELYRAFQKGKALASRDWKLKLRSSGELIEFRPNLSSLIGWARAEGLLHGQHNKRIEPLYSWSRNLVAHPSYHLVAPTQSARAIRDVAEIINRLWGQPTPGGRLYPAPSEREILIVGWSDGETGRTRTILRDFQLSNRRELGDWSCVVVRGVFRDEGLWDFDGQYERTVYPTDLLWGPGSVDDAREWLAEARAVGDTTTYLDRLFALRINEGKVSLARRPSVALSLSIERRRGRWLLVRADFPNDAFAHARHMMDGAECRGGEGASKDSVSSDGFPALSACPVEGVFDGDWETMAMLLKNRFGVVAEPLHQVRVPPRFSIDVAPDV